MSKKVISYLLKLVAILVFLLLLFVGLYIVPAYMRFFQRYIPTLSPVFSGVWLYINLSFVPVYICLVLAWQVFTTIQQDSTFCMANAKRLKTASWLALVGIGMVVAFYLFMQAYYAWAVSRFFLLTALCILFIGFAAFIVCFALSKLVAQAAELKQEVELTV